MVRFMNRRRCYFESGCIRTLLSCSVGFALMDEGLQKELREGMEEPAPDHIGLYVLINTY